MNIRHILVALVFLICIVSSYASARKLFAQSTARPSFSDFLKQMSEPSKLQQSRSQALKQKKTVKKKKKKLAKPSLILEQSIATFLDTQIPPLAKGLSDIVKGKAAEETIKKKKEKRTGRIKQFEASKKFSRSRSYRPSYGSSSSRRPSYNPYGSTYQSPSSYSSPYSGFSRPSYSSPYSNYGNSSYGGSSYSPSRFWDHDYSSNDSYNNNYGSSHDNSSSHSIYRDKDSEKESEEKKKNKTIIQNIRTKFTQKLQEINQEALTSPGQTTTRIIAFADGIKKELELLKTTQSQLTEKEQKMVQRSPANISIYTTFVPHLFKAFPSFLAKKELGVEGFQLILDEVSRIVSKEMLETKAAEFVAGLKHQQQLTITQANKEKKSEKLDAIVTLLEGVKESFPIAASNMNILDPLIQRAQELSQQLKPVKPSVSSKESSKKNDGKDDVK